MLYFAVAIAVTLLYVLISPRFCERIYRSKLFHPEPFPKGETGIASIYGVTGEEVFFSSRNGKVLNGWLYRCPDEHSGFVALCSHGNRGSVVGWETRTACLLEAGFSVFIYDYQGFGKSQGRPSVKRSCQDAAAAFDHLVEGLGFAPTNIVLYGASLGGGITCELARVRQCAAIILQSTFTNFARVSREVSALGKVFPAVLSINPSLNNLAFVKRFTQPLLVLHGRIDGYIRLHHGQALYDASASPRKQLAVLPREGHSDFGGRNPEILTRALSEFREVLEQV